MDVEALTLGIWDRVSRTLGELGEELLPDQVRGTVDGAREMLARGENGPAAAALEQALRAKPDHATARYLLGVARLRQGDATAAARELEAAGALRAGFTEAQVALAEARLLQGDPAAAIPLLREALARSNERELLADAYRVLGRAYLATGAVDKGLRELRKALAEDPGDADAALALADALLARGFDAEETRGALEKLCAGLEKPPRPAALGALGRLDLRAGRFDAAVAGLTRAVAGDLPAESRVATTAALADAHLKRGDTVAAHEQLLRALAVAPRDPSLHERMARLHLAARNPDAALESFVRAHNLGGGMRPLLDALDAALTHGERARATELARRLHDAGSDDARALALVALDSGRLDEARGLLGTDGRRGTATLLGELELAAGDAARASARALEALRAHADDGPARRLWEAASRRALGVAEPAGDIYALATRVHTLCTARLPQLAPDAARIVESYDRPLLVTVMGEFSSGKSTFVNAFLGAEVAPVGITPTTATINILKYGREKAARVIYRDDRTRDLPWADVPAVLKAVDAEEARRIRVVELLYPLEALQRVNIVDTPGLNSIMPEHEATARQFIGEADAVIWLFTAGQAGKATERDALERIRAEGVRVLGVLNKIDQISPEDRERLVVHVAKELGGLVEALVPVAGRRALAARKSGGSLAESNWPALEALLEERFFTQARTLKRDACGKRLGILLAGARGRVGAREVLAGERRDELRGAAGSVRADAVIFVRGVVPEETRSLRERTAGTYRQAAREVLELVRPRRTPFGSHSAAAADRAYLVGYLERALTDAVAPTRTRVLAELLRSGTDAAGAARAAEDMVGTGAAEAFKTGAADAQALVEARVFARAAAYVRGYLRGGSIDDFFLRTLPRLELTEDSVYHALFRDAPDLEAELIQPLGAHADEALRAMAGRLDQLAAVAEGTRLEADALDGALGACDDERRSLTASR